MKYSLKELTQLSGNAASIYCVHLDGEGQSEFHKFLGKHQLTHTEEVKEIVTRLKFMGQKFGARENYFKHNEGLPGDLVCALYDEENSNLRLYCIRLGSCTVILGGGSDKPKGIKAWQEKKDLAQHAELMIRVSKELLKAQKEGQIKISPSTNKIIGNLKFNEDEND